MFGNKVTPSKCTDLLCPNEVILQAIQLNFLRSILILSCYLHHAVSLNWS